MSETPTDDFDSISRLLHDRDLESLRAVVAGLTAAEVVDCMRRLPLARAVLLFRLLHKDVAMDVFERLTRPVQSDLVAGLRDEDLGELIEGLDPADRVGLFDELPAKVVHRLLSGLSARERSLTAPMLGYPSASVGRRMSPEYVRLQPWLTAREALARVRDSEVGTGDVVLLPVTDDVRRLVGVITLPELVRADGAQPIGELATAPVSRTAHTSAEEVARLCARHRLLGVPITDQESRLVGMIGVDDALQIIDEAEAEDAARAGGREPLRQPYLTTPVWRLVRARVGWLLVLALSAVLTVSVLERFEQTLSQAVVLALFIPLLTGIGGNTGSQAASTLTRSLAVSDVRPRDLGRVALREGRIGLTLGLLLGTLGLVLATPVYGFAIGGVIGSTLLLVCTMAATVGGAMPLLAKAMRVDPAAFSTPFISTFCDATGLLIYFGIATAVLQL